MKRRNSGITLIALIITIIIMLILAGVTISIVGGSDGIIAKVEKAVSETEKAAMQEDAELAVAAIKMDYYENYAANRASYANAKAFIVEKLKAGYETSRGAIMSADTAGNITYTFDEVTTSLTIDDNGKVTLGASSEDDSNGGTTTPAVQYTVTYNANGGTGAPTDSGEYAEGASVTVNFATIPTKSGYTFLGWATSASATTATYTSTGTTSFTMGTANVTLYAVWEETAAAIPAGLAVGDTVSYSPSGTYNWDAEYASSDLAVDGNADVALSSATGEDFNITSWKVFSIDETTGEVELVPSASTTGTVRLQGAQGYNNAVKLLNDACGDLYGDSSKGITARSINRDDIENIMHSGETNFVEYYETTYPSENYSWLDENYQATSAYTTDKNYPTIYEQEDLSTITYSGDTEETKVAVGTGLGRSEQTSLIGRTDAGAVSGDVSAEGKITTATSIRPYGTWYSLTYSEVSSLLGDYASLVLPSGTSTNYWVASRCVNAGSGDCNFSVARVSYGSLNANGLYYSNGGSNSGSRALFPVVSLSSELLTGDSASGWVVE